MFGQKLKDPRGSGFLDLRGFNGKAIQFSWAREDLLRFHTPPIFFPIMQERADGGGA